MASIVLREYLIDELMDIVLDYVIDNQRIKTMIRQVVDPVTDLVKKPEIMVMYFLNTLIDMKFHEANTVNELLPHMCRYPFYSKYVLIKRALQACVSYYLTREELFQELNDGHLDITNLEDVRPLRGLLLNMS